MRKGHGGPGRRQRLRRIAAGALLAVAAGSCSSVEPPPPDAGPFRVLVFSRTAGYRHPAIPTGIQAVRSLGAQYDFEVDATEDSGVFTDERLGPYDVVVWLLTTGDVLDDAQQAAFERWVRAGGGFAGVHSAADTEYEWPFYGRLVGAWFASHGLPQYATVAVGDRTHASTTHLGTTWSRFDEWYEFRTDPRATAHVLMSRQALDGQPHPLAWCSYVGAGRSWYTALGHTAGSYAEPAFRRHLAGGIVSVSPGAPAPACPAGLG